MTSRERLLAALAGNPVDHVPCAFMLFRALRDRCADEEAFVEAQLAMGLDACANVGYLAPACHPAVTETRWTEEVDGETIVCRRFDTPKGPLTQRVAQREGWPTEAEFTLFNDLVVPRTREILVKPEEDLEKLPYLLGPFRDEAIARLRESAAVARRVAGRRQLLQTGGWRSSYHPLLGNDGVMGIDAMAWLSGYEEVMILAQTDPAIIREYAQIIHAWNLRQIEIYLDVTDAELMLRRAWYETTDFWTPAAYREIIAPILRNEVDLVHQAGRRFGLIVTSAFLPILDDILATGIDVLVGLDPEDTGEAGMIEVKRACRQAGCAIWGGVSGSSTVEGGTPAETEAAVLRALELLGEGGGFILSPVDNVRENTATAWENTRVFIDTWKQRCGIRA